MKREELKTIREGFEKYCMEYVRAFEQKQGIEFNCWVAQDVGGVAWFNDEYVFSMQDIIHDVDRQHPKGLIMKWHSDCIDNAPKRINYRSYCMGLRFDMLNDYYVCAQNVTLVSRHPEGLLIRGVSEKDILKVQAKDAGEASAIAGELLKSGKPLE